MSACLCEGSRKVACSALMDRKVLVIEADVLVPMVIEDILADQHSVIIGPFTELLPALEAAHSAEIDFALLDVSPRGSNVYPVAEALSMRRIPCLLLSGYGAGAVPADRQGWRVCCKPFSGDFLVRKMVEGLEEIGCD